MSDDLIAQKVRSLPGLVATVCLNGSVTPQFASALSDMRSYNDRTGLHRVEYRTFHAVLVEAGRDEAAAHMLQADGGAYQWLLQIDADAAPFPPDALERMLRTMFVDMPICAALGAYCQLKGPPHFPTIDTGSGTWEEHYPGEGLIPAIRTGAHFLLTRRDAFIGTGPPWFRTRLPMTPIRAMAEVDGFARRTLGGNNPLAAHPEWNTMLHNASTQSRGGETHVGEDSAFCDKLRAIGAHIYVDTDLVIGHVSTHIITPKDFIDAMRQSRARQRAALGITGAA